jgi:hypothetical protein
VPITTIDFPEETKQYVDSLLKNGKVKSLKALISDMLAFHKAFSMNEWNDNIFYFFGLRHAFFSQRSLRLLIENIKSEKRLEMGRRMGQTWIDAHFAKYGGPIIKEKWQQAFKILENVGWGTFEMFGKTLVVKRSFLPIEILHGYLETGMQVKLEKVTTTDQICVFNIIEKL